MHKNLPHVPHGFTPSLICQPEADALLKALCILIGERDLEFIAQADYGCSAPAHLAMLHRIARNHEIPRPLLWEPREVLELTRWSEPQPLWTAEEMARFHHRRAFSCTVLLRADVEPENQGYPLYGQNATLIHLIESLSALKAGLEQETLAFFTWRVDRLRNDAPEEIAYCGLALLWAALAVPGISGAVLMQLVDLIFACEEHAAAAWQWRHTYPDCSSWLLHLGNDDACHPKWRAFGALLTGQLRPHHSKETFEWVEIIAGLLAAS